MPVSLCTGRLFEHQLRRKKPAGSGSRVATRESKRRSLRFSVTGPVEVKLAERLAAKMTVSPTYNTANSRYAAATDLIVVPGLAQYW